MSMSNALRYLVARNDAAQFPIVTIRGYVATDHPHTSGLSKAEAWDRAQYLARPIKLARSARKASHPAAAIEYRDDVTQMTTVVQTAAATQDMYEGKLREERKEENVEVAIDNTQPTVHTVSMPATTYPASPAQITFIQNLMDERLTAEQREAAADRFATIDGPTASKWIQRLKELPKLSAPVTNNTNDVPAGHYALDEDGHSEGSIVTKFYKIDKPTEGRWAGYTFVKVQASDDYYPVRDKAARERILRLISNDPMAASTRYGREIGKCGVCHRTLTDEQSRAAGIGPVCAEKTGW